MQNVEVNRRAVIVVNILTCFWRYRGKLRNIFVKVDSPCMEVWNGGLPDTIQEWYSCDSCCRRYLLCPSIICSPLSVLVVLEPAPCNLVKTSWSRRLF